MIYEYANLRGIELLAEEYCTGAKLLENAAEYPLIILDYNLRGVNGLETARQLRKKKSRLRDNFFKRLHGLYSRFL